MKNNFHTLLVVGNKALESRILVYRKICISELIFFLFLKMFSFLLILLLKNYFGLFFYRKIFEFTVTGIVIKLSVFISYLIIKTSISFFYPLLKTIIKPQPLIYIISTTYVHDHHHHLLTSKALCRQSAILKTLSPITSYIIYK